MNATTLDWCIIAVYLIISFCAGIYARRFADSLSGFLVAGRRLRVGIGTATMIATELGTVTVMYMGENGYLNGFAAFSVGIIALLAFLFVGSTGFIIERLRALKVMTVPEYYEIRYTRTVRILGGLILFIGGVLNMGVFLKLDGVFLSHALGFGEGGVVAVMVGMLCVVGLYTIFGGMFSVVVTDYLQYAVMTVGMLLATIFAFRSVSLGAITAAVSSQIGPGGFNPLVNAGLGWTFLWWMLLSNIAAAALWQPATSRALSAESPQTGRRVYLISSLTFAGRAMIPMMWGIIALTLYPGLTGDQAMAAMPRMLGAVLPTGVIGVLVAGMLAASMSTYSAYLLAWASVISRDVIAALFPHGLPEKTVITITRVWVAIIGIFLLVFGMLYHMPASALKYIYITGNMYTAGAVSAVGFGLYWKRATTTGAYIALVTGATAPLGFLVLAQFRDILPAGLVWMADVNLSGFLAFALGAAGMIIGSLLTSPPPSSALEEARP